MDIPSTEHPYPLDFLHPTFRRGLQSTLRSGDKHAGLIPGQRLELRGPDGEPLPTHGKVVRTVEYDDFDDIPDYYIQLNHASPTREQLIDAMVEAYGPTWESEGLTLILFQV